MLHWRADWAAPTVIPVSSVAPRASGSAGDAFAALGSTSSFGRNAEIFGEDEPAHCLYAVVRGAVRMTRLMSDGRRQVGAFHLPGEIFGMEAEDLHHFSAEAIVDSIVLVVRRSAILTRAAGDRELVTRLWTQTVAQLNRAQNHMLLLGRTSAQERLAAFLLDMAARLPPGDAVELPMSRQDIADYLGLTIETVSRTLTQLERSGVIAMPASRRIELCDRAALDEISDRLAA